MIDIEHSCCFTGYRPEKFSFVFESDCAEYRSFSGRLASAVAEMLEKGCNTFYVGMAKGFDIAAGEHIAAIKQLRRDIKLIAVVPFPGQRDSMDAIWKQRYDELLPQCDETITVCPSYERSAFARRNRYMVDRSRYIICYYDGKPGGTKSTLEYAVRNGCEVMNIHETDPLEELKSRFYPAFRIYPPDDGEQE